MDSSESVGPASTKRTVKNPLYKPATKEKPLPDTPNVKRLAKLQNSYCDNTNAEYDGPRCLDIRCCRHRMLSTRSVTSQERASAHERECQAGGHRQGIRPASASEHSSESERGSESDPKDIEIVSDSEMDSEEEAANVVPTDSEDEWQREVNETEANQDSMSSYELDDKNIVNYMDLDQGHTAPSTPIRVRKWEINYDSEDEVNWGDLYKQYDGEERSWPFPEDTRQVIRTGAKPKI